ncbi:ArsR/SmtB family transcription factor [Actinomadura rupiterrae]|uniref:ArsR/SmtB family transcription factor n=1 Tax=Actinomadura rupiterrae TaxID=559627 RepID=UPI0020A5F25C|nr:metalloregulator ArsR/SmtB family transcription factor [Actinomadura rupiterrae]MCP2338947.1 DNA-binding transcriptional ArsR family regulator [Actinomadura rupiterrae]
MDEPSSRTGAAGSTGPSGPSGPSGGGADLGTEPEPVAKPAAEPVADVVDGVLNALADPTRRRLLDLLAAHGQATATTLAEGLPISRQAVVKHLAVLDAAGLVQGVRAGREVRYSVGPEALDTTARWMAALASEWDRRLARIKRLAEAAEHAERPGPAE